jgi:hypothetical protein
MGVARARTPDVGAGRAAAEDVDRDGARAAAADSGERTEKDTSTACDGALAERATPQGDSGESSYSTCHSARDDDSPPISTTTTTTAPPLQVDASVDRLESMKKNNLHLGERASPTNTGNEIPFLDDRISLFFLEKTHPERGEVFHISHIYNILGSFWCVIIVI